MDDQKAVQLLRKGDMVGLEYLVKQYQLKAIRAVYLIVRNREVAEDIVQQAFIRIYERIDQYDDQRPFAPWFFKIVINDALKCVTREKHTVPLDLIVQQNHEFDFGILAHGFSNPEEAVQSSEIHEQLWEAIGSLTPEQRVVYVLRYYFAFTIPELIEELEKPETTIKWRLRTALNRLRHKLKSNDL